MENYSLSDIAAVSGNEGFGGANAWVLIILFALIFGNGGFGFGGGNHPQYATAADMQNGFNQQETNGHLRGLTYGLSDSTFALNNTIVNEGRAMQTQLANCCCENLRNTDALRFDMANYNAGITAAIHAEGEATRNLIQRDKIEALQSQVNQLQLQQAMCGVVRYPTASTYAAQNPFCGCGNI